MGIFGTLVGGSVGFMLGGPLGAVLGGAIGATVSDDKPAAGRIRAPGAGAGSAPTLQTVFAVALTSLAAKVAKADGQVTEEEVHVFDAFLRESLHMSAAERRVAARVFNEARDSPTPASEFSRQVRSLLGGQTDRLRDIVTILLAIAFADGSLHSAEDRLIRGIAGDLGLTEDDYRSCKATFDATAGTSDFDPYEVLGLPPTASDAELRTAHRRLARDYHPDVVRSKGLPDDFLAFANQKMAAINEAWERIKRERRM